MHNEKHSLYFLLALIGVTLILSFFIFRPFLYALILALVCAVIFQPLYKKILKLARGRAGIAACVTAGAILILIITPLVLLGVQVFKEASGLYSFIAGGGGAGALDAFRGFIPEGFSLDIASYIKQGAGWLIEHLSIIFSSFVKIFINSFIFIIALYYFLKDGARLKDMVVLWSPLKDNNDEIVLGKLERAVDSVVKGKLLIALIQGVLTVLGFLIFSVPNAALWGTVAAVVALIPMIGTALVFVPAVLFLFVQGAAGAAAGLVVWGVAVVGMADNILGPKIMGRGLQLHSLAILLSVLGGIAFFGPMGFILGPLTVSLLLALTDIYFST